MQIGHQDALVIVDVQGAFLSGGGLPVPNGEEAIPAILNAAEKFECIVATRDFHPKGHVSLASSYLEVSPKTLLVSSSLEVPSTTALDVEMLDQWQLKPSFNLSSYAKFSRSDLRAYLRRVGTQIIWPDHAIQGTPEVDFEPRIAALPISFAVNKGMNPTCDSYSGFKDALGIQTDLAKQLRQRGITRIFVCGLAFDFCVGETALHGAELGFQTFVLMDASRSVDVNDSKEKMRLRLSSKGVRMIQSIHLR